MMVRAPFFVLPEWEESPQKGGKDIFKRKMGMALSALLISFLAPFFPES